MPNDKGDDDMTKDFTKYVTTRQAAEMLGYVAFGSCAYWQATKANLANLGTSGYVAPSLEKYLATADVHHRATRKFK